MAVAGGEGVGGGLLGLVGGDLEDAEPEDRDLDAVVEGDEAHENPSVLLMDKTLAEPAVVGAVACA